MPRDLLTPDFPQVLSVEVTTRCNLKCKMCALVTGGTRSSHQPGHIEAASWDRILEAARDVAHINVNGWGENFSNPRFISLMEDLDRLGTPTNFSTNGTYLTEENVAKLATLRHLRSINVSIDSPDPETYHAIRGGSLERVLWGLRNLVAGLPRSERITVSSVVMRSNVLTLVAFPALLASIGVRNYVLQGFVDTELRIPDESLDPDPAVQEAVATVRASCSELGINLLLNPYLGHHLARRDQEIWSEHPAAMDGAQEAEEAVGTKQCASPWDHVFVNKDGQVIPCCNAPVWEESSSDGQSIMGDLSSQSFAEIWRGEKFRRFRRDLLEGPPPSICRTCTVTSTGTHFFRLFATEMEAPPLWVRPDRVELAFRNTGIRTWTRETGLRIGTSAPRDRPSSWHHPEWLSPYRIAGISEEVVKPGEVAHFEFPVSASEGEADETFVLLVEGVWWLQRGA
jgi:MoaA/NifB/PqqE/SkfB family radical SAM enzyme